MLVELVLGLLLRFFTFAFSLLPDGVLAPLAVGVTSFVAFMQSAGYYLPLSAIGVCLGILILIHTKFFLVRAAVFIARLVRG
jgi:hypothetical protein